MATLSYMTSAGETLRHSLAQRAAIGRHPAQDIQLLDRVVSKEHAVVELRDGSYWVVDKGSRNGTYLNGRRLREPAQLTHGDKIKVGSTTMTFWAPSPHESLVSRVTVQGEGVESAIRTRVKSDTSGFPPEHAVDDVDTLRADYEKLRIANELNQALSEEYDLERLLHKILDRAFAIFRCDRGVILIHDEATGTYVPHAARLRSGHDSAENIKISETILREVVERHQSILSSDAMIDSRFQGSHSIMMEGIRSTMTVPLLYQERLLGIIHLDSQVATGAFSDKDLQLLAGFAQQAAMSIEHARLVERIRSDALNREKLGRLLSPALVQQVLDGRADIRKGGDSKQVTVLFADIRGFTTMSEKIPAQDIVTMLNEFFEIMVEIIFDRGGTLDKFIGDAIMAVWGAPFSAPDDALKAVQASVEMQNAITEFNEIRNLEGLEPIHIGIGLSSGECVAGYMGSSRAMSYTAVGDVVNTASRVCNVAAPDEVVITRATLEQLGTAVHVEALPPRELRGKSKAVDIYRVLTVAGV